MRAVVIFSFWIFGQALAAQSTFQMTYGGDDTEFGISVDQTSDGGFVCLGNTWSDGISGLDMYLLKTDANGNELWNQAIGTENWEFGISIQETSDDGLILCGGVNGPENDSLVLIKTSSNGDILWNKRFSGSMERDVGQSVCQTSDNGFIAVGFTGTDFMEDIYVVKTDESGNEEWSQVYPSSGKEYAVSVQQLADNGFIMVGETSSIGAGGKDFYLLRTDEFGDILWTQTFGSELDEVGRDVQLTDDGGFILVGYEEFSGGDVILIKTDSQGELEWTEKYENDGWDLAHSVKQMPDGGYVVGGRKENTTENTNHMHCFRTDGSGVIIWETTLPMGFGSTGNSLLLASDGDIVILGTSSEYISDTQFNADFYLAKINADGPVGLTDEFDLDGSIELYPNPFSDYLYVVSDQGSTEAMSIEFVDVSGKLVHQQLVGPSQSERIMTCNVGAGVYLVLLKQDGRVISRQTLVAH